MQIIPVIDLKDGCVVRARHGNRSDYQPINSFLCHSCSPMAIVNAFLKLYDFRTIYIADLNAITHSGCHCRIIDRIVRTYRDIEFWVDEGLKITELPRQNHYRPIIGSESQQSIAKIPDNKFILSLDFNNNQPSGPIELFEKSCYWPTDVIIMSLAKVGSMTGPDFEKHSAYRRQYPQNNFIAAGGIRHLDDLFGLNKIGVQQALLASALHSGVITATEIRELDNLNG